MDQTEPRFVVDDMVGKLAKWLRILGYDTLYFRKIDDRQLLDIALKENLVLWFESTMTNHMAALLKYNSLLHYLVPVVILD